jgi:hypothetical protein
MFNERVNVDILQRREAVLSNLQHLATKARDAAMQHWGPHHYSDIGKFLHCCATDYICSLLRL